MNSPIMVAIDTTDRESALVLAAATVGSVGAFKVGLGLLHSVGPDLIGELAALGRPVFADAKLHDIPSQVERASSALGAAGARWVTVHSSGGRVMMESAVRGLTAGSDGVAGVLAVSVLTSLDAAELAAVGIAEATTDLVEAMAGTALRAGVEGVVCSPHEIALVKKVAPETTIVAPGIRPPGAAVGDQRRTATPQEALQAGATWLVIGRPITGDHDPAGAASRILASLKQ